MTMTRSPPSAKKHHIRNELRVVLMKVVAKPQNSLDSPSMWEVEARKLIAVDTEMEPVVQTPPLLTIARDIFESMEGELVITVSRESNTCLLKLDSGEENAEWLWLEARGALFKNV